MDTLIAEALRTWREHALIREGRRNRVYKDILGKLTGGIGHLIKPEEMIGPQDKIPDAQIEKWFREDTEKSLRTSIRHMNEIGIKNSMFLAALISVNFQLGDFSVKFPNSYELLKAHKFDDAINNLRKSLWMRQTPVRVKDFIKAIESLK